MRYIYTIIVTFSFMFSLSAGDKAPGAEETLMYYYINRVRSNPGLEANRINEMDIPGRIDKDALVKSLLESKPVNQLVMNLSLNEAAYKHSEWIMEYKKEEQEKGKRLFTGVTATDRANNSGYANKVYDLSIKGISPWHCFLDILVSKNGLKKIMNPRAAEIGIGSLDKSGDFVMNIIISQTLTKPKICGVIFKDRNNNGVLDNGEGLKDVSIALNTESTNSYDGGCYLMDIPAEMGKEPLIISYEGKNYTQKIEKGSKRFFFDLQILSKEKMTDFDRALMDLKKSKLGTLGHFRSSIRVHQMAENLESIDSKTKNYIKIKGAEILTKLDASKAKVIKQIDENPLSAQEEIKKEAVPYKGTDAWQWYKEALYFCKLKTDKINNLNSKTLTIKISNAMKFIKTPYWMDRLNKLSSGEDGGGASGDDDPLLDF